MADNGFGSFFATLGCESLDWHASAPSRGVARSLQGYEGLYNTRRIHSVLGFKAPSTYAEQLDALVYRFSVARDP